ncbi:MAG: bifunctional enoyl-CoA hydratase/phosphate acetyltransferase [Burkholderiaceae bacterium]|nr:bifunctional enoyl-CoA hydratase/phosphate acetyltransferase [Burkholderiaceae bacterium]MCD8538097.1 bifunctional enoyl-CoA hydratase/phosphate acetyltransferase [Burkholderiaceae bacterium]
MSSITNKTWDELKVGDTASFKRTVTARDLYLFAHASGNLNPLHLPVQDSVLKTAQSVAPSMWVGSLISSLLGNVLPGPGTLYLEQNFQFVERAHLGDVLTISVRLLDKLIKPQVLFDTSVTDQNNRLIATGHAKVSAPTQSVTIQQTDLPGLTLETHDHFTKLLELTKGKPAMTCAVVCPTDHHALAGALLARDHDLITPVLIGPETLIRDIAEQHRLNLSNVEIVDVSLDREAARTAVEMVHQGRVRSIMKGNLHSDDLLGQVVKREGGLRGKGRISHAFVLDVPTQPEPIIISDAAINIAPDLITKVDITQNAIDLAVACGMDKPRVAILSAVETVNPHIPSSMEAAIIAKMADRGQIKGGLVDGPLAMDNAIDMGAARDKHIESEVAGQAQVLIVPNLEAGNMLAKQLTFVSHAQPAGLVLGARVPVMLTSRADNEQARLFSCVLAALYEDFLNRKNL